MSTFTATSYADAKARIERGVKRLATFLSAIDDFQEDKTNTIKRNKVMTMLRELTDIRSHVESDLQIMESSVNLKLVPDIFSHELSQSLADTFDTLYYELLSSADILGMSTSQPMDMSSSLLNASINPNTTISSLTNFHLPKRKFPIFSGNISEWQGFENLFNSILSHVPNLPDVERFEILKTSLEGEALALIKHLPITVPNYHSAWNILRTQYGNKRDLARHHLDALLSTGPVSSNNVTSIKTVINSIVEHLAALNNLGFTTKQWSPMLIHIFEKTLDKDLRSRWELIVGNRHLPSTDEFVDFLRSHLRSAEAISTQFLKVDKKPQPYFKTTRSAGTSKVLMTSMTSASDKCDCCHDNHEIRKCPLFLIKKPKERFNFIKERRMCINCLRIGHSASNCTSRFFCKNCNKPHHSLLHFETVPTFASTKSVNNTTPTLSQASSAPSSNVQCNSVLLKGNVSTGNQLPLLSLTANNQLKPVVLLSTILVQVRSITNELFTLRALLDSGAQASFITDDWASRLSLRRRRCDLQVSALSNVPLKDLKGFVTLDLCALNNDTSISVNAIVMSTITDRTPQAIVTAGKWDHLSNIQLADPQYCMPGPVDLLLGAEVTASLLTGGVIRRNSDEPIAVNTSFGWVIMGPTGSNDRQSDIKSFHISITENFDNALKKFWEVEEPPSVQCSTLDDIQAEQIYKTTVTRLETGRFMISLPFRTSRPILGDSFTIALHRFRSLEQRLAQHPQLQKEYHEFMKDYLDCNHMERIATNDEQNPYSYYIPHHCVLKPDSTTTKLRVVFNASSKTKSGQSLNEVLLSGPKLQPNLQFILLGARLSKYIFMADIKQMYRQILIQPEDRNYLRILWRFNLSEPITTYQLCTVTYGTSCAPYQALRTLSELAKIGREKFPLASDILLTDTYVDDILSGAETDEEVLHKQNQLIALCGQGKFELRKWASNNSKILQAVSEENRLISPAVLFEEVDNKGVKILGMQWNPKEDTFSYKLSSVSNTPTKRLILSEIAKIFDPLGLLSPVIFLLKQFMQQLWTAGIGWDDPIPSELSNIWLRYRNEFTSLSNVNVPRRITCDNPISYQLHVFTDSSEKGYAAAVYLRGISSDNVNCHLITAKSKVAPLKCLSIPRLELCAAVLGAKLLHTISAQFKKKLVIDTLHAWTDSTTVLAWIRSSPHRWVTFVANRTSLIQDLTAPAIWRHVPTHENPVDCASRGLFPTELITHPLWWSGPTFLFDDESTWPTYQLSNQQPKHEVVPELRKITVHMVTEESEIQSLLTRCSSWEKIKRIIAYCLKWKLHLTSLNKIVNKLSPADLNLAIAAIVRSVQHVEFKNELSAINLNKPLMKPFRRLDLFLDSSGILRVGGRIRNASIPYSQKHPMLLPKQHRLTEIIIDAYHNRLCHPGTLALQSNLQRDFWIISARQAIRSRVRKCIACFRHKPKEIVPKMASLPTYRLQQIKPFCISGVDYAGPLLIKQCRGRNIAPIHMYICLFVCMTTKALHLELSSDLSTESFLLAFSRFAARRGPIQEIHSDCGTNFVGASKLLSNFTSSANYQTTISNKLASQNIHWSFNPPSAPHFGGLWEAGVKSTKSLLLRSIGTHKLTYEELYTVLTRIEATLNSRPLCALSNDSNDLEALTPSHFLTLEPPTSLPDPTLTQVPMSKLQRWRLISDIHQCFWTRWQNEYLVSLQMRAKWTTQQDSVKVGDLMLIKEPTPPLTWRLGRVKQLHPGSDGIVRVATLQTQHGTFTRPVIKLCPLPIC